MNQLLKNREALLAGVIVVMVALISVVVPSFIAPGNLLAVYNDTSILIILALGQMMVIITRCIDLSISANVALSGMIVATLNYMYPDLSIFVIILIGAAVGTILGMINGLLVWKLNIPSIVVTLGTMSIYRGIVFLISNGAWINAHQMRPTFSVFQF